MKVLSLFDGMSCGRLALERAGIEVDNYYASEIDKYAIQIAQKNFPDTIQLGDVTKWEEWSIDWSSIELIFAGFPCQAWSMAGKQKGDTDPRGALVHDLTSIWNKVKQHNPDVKFLFENVKMKKQFLDYISDDLFGVSPSCINSALVSAQNRVRYYWNSAGIVPQPDDLNILLPDVLEEGVVDRDKSYCIDANYWKGTNVEQYIKKGRRQIAFTERRTEDSKRIRREYKKLYGRDFSPRRGKELVARDDGKMNCLTATYSIKEHTLIDEKLYYRKLTPLECERLQTLPDQYTEGVSNTQRYKMIGNGWTVDVIVHILKEMFSDQKD